MGGRDWIQQAVFALRRSVFVDEQGIAPELEFDQKISSAIITLLAEGQVPIATIRYQSLDSQTIQPDRFCVAKNYRKQGIGRQLLAAYEQKRSPMAFAGRFCLLKLQQSAFIKNAAMRSSLLLFEEDGILCVKWEKNLLLKRRNTQ